MLAAPLFRVLAAARSVCQFEAHRLAHDFDLHEPAGRLLRYVEDERLCSTTGLHLERVERSGWNRYGLRAEDRERDRARLEKELAETEKLLAATQAKLANEAFVNKAPAQVVDGVRAREAELQELAARLREHLDS